MIGIGRFLKFEVNVNRIRSKISTDPIGLNEALSRNSAAHVTHAKASIVIAIATIFFEAPISCEAYW